MELKPVEKLRQRNLMDWEDKFNARREGKQGTANLNTCVVQAAIESGWFLNGANVDDVPSENPQEVTRIAADIDSIYQGLTTVEKKE